MLVSGIQHSDSVLYINLFRIFSHKVCYKILSIAAFVIQLVLVDYRFFLYFSVFLGEKFFIFRWDWGFKWHKCVDRQARHLPHGGQSMNYLPSPFLLPFTFSPWDGVGASLWCSAYAWFHSPHTPLLLQMSDSEILATNQPSQSWYSTFSCGEPFKTLIAKLLI